MRDRQKDRQIDTSRQTDRQAGRHREMGIVRRKDRDRNIRDRYTDSDSQEDRYHIKKCIISCLPVS